MTRGPCPLPITTGIKEVKSRGGGRVNKKYTCCVLSFFRGRWQVQVLVLYVGSRLGRPWVSSWSLPTACMQIVWWMAVQCDRSRCVRSLVLGYLTTLITQSSFVFQGPLQHPGTNQTTMHGAQPDMYVDKTYITYNPRLSNRFRPRVVTRVSSLAAGR